MSEVVSRVKIRTRVITKPERSGSPSGRKRISPVTPWKAPSPFTFAIHSRMRARSGPTASIAFTSSMAAS